MRTAIVYYSMSGNTKYTADKIADEIKASGEVDIIRGNQGGTGACGV